MVAIIEAASPRNGKLVANERQPVNAGGEGMGGIAGMRHWTMISRSRIILRVGTRRRGNEFAREGLKQR
jgi:hypothetical protein